MSRRYRDLPDYSDSKAKTPYYKRPPRSWPKVLVFAVLIVVLYYVAYNN